MCETIDEIFVPTFDHHPTNTNILIMKMTFVSKKPTTISAYRWNDNFHRATKAIDYLLYFFTMTKDNFSGVDTSNIFAELIKLKHLKSTS